MPAPRRPWPTALITGLAVLSASCSHYKPPPLRTANSFDEVGDVQVALVSVTPFEAMVAKLSPDFDIKGKAAYDDALQTTRATQSTVSRATEMLLGVAVPGSDPASAAASSPQLPPNTASAPGVGGVAQHNAVLRYQLATALLQEVQMLNTYVSDAPRLQGFDRFLVRFQVAVRPRAVATPYNAQVELNFVNPDGGQAPVVVPLLSTDVQDAASVSSLDRNLQQVGLALSALKGVYGLQGSLAHNAEDVVSSLGWQYQSVSNVATPSPQTLSMRIAAQPTGVNRFELLPRVHHLTALLLVPHDPDRCTHRAGTGARKPGNVGFTIDKRFVHATTATELASTQAARTPTSFQVRPWGDPVLPADKQRAALVFNDTEPYSAKLYLRGGNNLTQQSVRSVAMAASAASADSAASDPASTSDSKSARKSDRKADNRTESQVATQRTSVSADSARFESVDVDPETTSEHRSLVATFSPLNAKDVEDLTKAKSLDLTLRLGLPLCVNPSDPPGTTEVMLTVTPSAINAPKAPDPSTQATVTVSPQVLVKADGTARLSVAVKFPAKPSDKQPLGAVKLSLTGALPGVPVLTGDYKACAKLDLTELVVTGDCLFDVPLSNLKSSGSLKIKQREYATATASSADASKDLAAVSLQAATASAKTSSSD